MKMKKRIGLALAGGGMGAYVWGSSSAFNPVITGLGALGGGTAGYFISKTKNKKSRKLSLI